MHQMPEWMNEQEVAEWINVPLEVIHDAVQKGRLPVLVIGPYIRIHRDDLLKLKTTSIQNRFSLEAGVSRENHPSIMGIPVPKSMVWLAEISPDVPKPYQWPDGKPPERYENAWKATISLQGKRIQVSVRQGRREVPMISDDGKVKRLERERLVVFFHGMPKVEFVETKDSKHYASLIRPDGRRILAIDEVPPVFYQGSMIMPYRDATEMTGSGVPKGMAVVIDKADIQSAVNHAAVRFLYQNRYTVEPDM